MCSSTFWIPSPWDAGFCHTYNPPEHLPPLLDHRIGIFLGHNSLNAFKSYSFKSFKLYIHEKGQFWPKSELESVYEKTIVKNQFKVLKFHIVRELKVIDNP